jgi:hypothetical protein
VPFVKRQTIQIVAFVPPHQLAGLELRMRPADVRTLAAFGRDLTALGDMEGADGTPETLERAVEVFDAVRARFAEHLAGWDLEAEQDDGSAAPVPATLAGLAVLDDEELIAAVHGWLQAISTLEGESDAPLGQPSSDGAPSDAAQLMALPTAPASRAS